MSAIAGLVHLDGRPCDPAAVQKLADALAYRAPGGTSIWTEGSAGLVHGLIVTTPESATERQPVVDAGAGLAITFDGRLDNRADLSRLLDVAIVDRGAIGDAELILRAYRVFGDAVVDHLLGDFSFAIWETPRRRLFCARDAMGVKPFCYRVDRHSIAWASDIGVLAAAAGPIPAPNEGMVGEYLAGVITDKRETLFRDILRLPPAHLLTADARGIAVRAYWRPDPQRELRYRRDEEYVEQLSELAHSAVAARLRTRRTVGVMLSGGVDSSAVTGIATQLWREGVVPCAGLETFSISVPGPDDERPFFDQVADRWQLPAHCTTVRPPTKGQFRDEIARHLDVLTYANAPAMDPLCKRAQQRGVDVLLTGIGADEWLGSGSAAYADLLKQGRLGALARRWRCEASLKDFMGWRAAAKAAVWPLVPALAQHAIKRALRRGRPPAWLDPDFAARIDLAGRLARHDDGLRFPSLEQTETWHEGTSGSAVHSAEMFDRAGARFGIEHWHPFQDRRIVEFGLALPAEQRWRDGREKDLFRRAMAPHVPPAIASRLLSPGASGAFVEAIVAEGGPAPFDDMAAERLGWVRGPLVRELYQRMTHLYHSGDARYPPMAWTLWLILSIEMWLQVVTRAPITAPERFAAESETVVQ